MHIFAAIVLAASIGSTLTVVDDAGKPVAGAEVTLAVAGSRVTLRTDADGRVDEPFVPQRYSVHAGGFVDKSGPVTGERIVLARVPRVVGRVRVATGQSAELHQLPVAADVLGSSAIQASPMTTTDALLRSIPGFDRTRSNAQFTNYGQLRVSIGGAGSDRGAVFVDGLPAQDGFGGQVDWLAYPVRDLTRAEILRGSGSALYGTGGIGGVLALSTIAPQFNAAPNGEVSFATGAHDLNAFDATLSASLGHDLAATLYSHQDSLSYRALAPGYASRIDHPSLSTDGVTALRIRAGTDAHYFDFTGRLARDDQDEGRSNYTFARNYDELGLGYVVATAGSNLAIDTYDRTTYVVNNADQYPAAPGVLRYHQVVPTAESGVSLNYARTGPYATYAFRADERSIQGESRQTGPAGALQSDTNGHEQVAGSALQATLNGARSELLLGLRADRIGYDSEQIGVNPVPAVVYQALTPRAAARYDLAKWATLRASAGSGFRTPYLNELIRSYQIGMVAYEANAHLTPERSFTETGGIDLGGASDRFAFDVAQTTVHNAIDFATIAPTVQQYSNVEQTRTNGETATYTHNFSSCSQLRASGTAQYARITSGASSIIGKRLEYVPDHSATFAFATTAGNLTYSVETDFLGQMFADDLNTELLPATTVYGGSISVPVGGNATVSLIGSNVTDRRYLSSIDRYAPPQSIRVEFRAPIGGRRGSIAHC